MTVDGSVVVKAYYTCSRGGGGGGGKRQVSISSVSTLSFAFSVSFFPLVSKFFSLFSPFRQEQSALTTKNNYAIGMSVLDCGYLLM